MPTAPLGFRKRLALEAHRLQHKQRVREHELRTLFWECTLRCNVSCRHCGSDCRQSSGVDELSGEQFLSIVDCITPHVDTHKVLIIFTGGEALVRPDIEDIGLQLYRREYPWGIVTNGMLLDENRLETLLQAGMHTLTISLDGFEKEHNYLRRHPLSFARVMGAIDALAHIPHELKWDIVTCVNPTNIDYLPQFRDFLIEKGVPAWRLFSIFPVGRAAGDMGLQLSDQQYVRLMEFIADTQAGGKITASYGCEGYLGEYETKVRENFYTCHAGVSVASVLCDGTISACPSIRSNYYQGNALQDDFMTVWNERFAPYRDRSWARKGKIGRAHV